MSKFFIYQSKNRSESYSRARHDRSVVSSFFLKEANSNGWRRGRFEGRDE